MTYEEWKRAEEFRRHKERGRLKRMLKKGEPRKRVSVATVSGGLPSLGRRR